ncbi:MAG: CBS domain-containing protein [Spirochaetia bacterium]|nr:CBS domain-containing protein [Spirochaetia bacterium]
MDTNALAVSLHKSWADIVPGLKASNASYLVILDDDQRPVALLSALNLLNLVLPHSLELSQLPINESRPFSRLVPVQYTAPLWDAVNTMDIRQVDRLVVVDDRMKYRGIISASDILKCAIESEAAGSRMKPIEVSKS